MEDEECPGGGLKVDPRTSGRGLKSTECGKVNFEVGRMARAESLTRTGSRGISGVVQVVGATEVGGNWVLGEEAEHRCRRSRYSLSWSSASVIVERSAGESEMGNYGL